MKQGDKMKIKIDNIDINYVQYGKGQDVILLHGWGQNIAMMEPLGNMLSENFRITIIDLPGFGNSEEPSCALSLYNYYEILVLFLKKLKITKPILVGHSFGGRIALIYASLKETEKLVLFGAPFEKRVKSLSLKIKLYKKIIKLPLINKFENSVKKHIGSVDYRNASPIMRRTLVNTVNEDLTEYAKKISCPTILIWGSKDTEVTVAEAQRLESLIKDCGLIIYPELTHYAYLENLKQTVNILDNFFIDKDDRK